MFYGFNVKSITYTLELKYQIIAANIYVRNNYCHKTKTLMNKLSNNYCDNCFKLLDDGDHFFWYTIPWTYNREGLTTYQSF